MKEMVGGCCVCSDERGWPDNPLVYCDGTACTVAVHQACYGIVTVPVGPWYCRKCESPDRQTKVRCELCPSRSGALKRVETGGWAHVVCALYIPEVRFGNVTSMEPIILQLIPTERYNKACYICQELGKINRASIGACMQCNKTGCKQQFHVTCAQGLGLLCEEAGNYLDNVKYCGYCQHHYGKLKKGGNVKTIPPYKPISQDGHSSDSSPEKEVVPVKCCLDNTPVISSVITASNTSSSSSSTAKNNQTKSSAGRKSSQSSSSGSGKSQYAGNRVSSAVTSTITSATASSSDTTAKIIQNDAVASTSKTPTSSAEKSSSKRWNSTSPSQDVSLLNSSSSSSGSMSNSRVIELSSSSESLGRPSEGNVGHMPKGKLPKNSSGKGSGSKSTAVITNASVLTTNSATVISAPSTHQAEASFSKNESNENTPAVEVYIPSNDIKQTKKKKAVSQSAVQDLSVHSADATNNTASTSTARDRSYISNDRNADSNNEEKLKKHKAEPGNTSIKSSTITSSQAYSSGLNIQMEPNLMAAAHAPQNNPPMAHAPSPINHPSTSMAMVNQPYMIDRTSHGHAVPSISHPINDLTHGINANHTVTSANTIDLASTPSMSPQPSGSGWGLKVAYEPQIPVHTSNNKPAEAEMLYPLPKRQRLENVDLTGKAAIKQQGAILIDSIDKMASIASGGIRNKKRAAMAASVSMVPPSNQSHMTNLQSVPNSKRINQPTPPPSTSSTYQAMHSPPVSPGEDKNIMKSNISRLTRAPHMLGNELNPDSAAAARLSEHLSAELAAHSVFRAPSPMVHPPLMNRATSSGRYGVMGSGLPLSLGSGGAQSLDQLLERQWEQGSQFLMEQAQHFDIASLLSCLHQLRSENVNLEEHVGALTERRDHLLAVNARLAIPLNTVPAQASSEHVRMSREAATNMARQPQPMQQPPPMPQHSRADVMNTVERNQQLLMRDIQQKPS